MIIRPIAPRILEPSSLLLGQIDKCKHELVTGPKENTLRCRKCGEELEVKPHGSKP